MTDRIVELTMTFLPIAPEILTVSLLTLISMTCIILFRRQREHAVSAMERAHRNEVARTTSHLDRVQRQLAKAFDACEKDEDFADRA